jgi:hypothetical protein
MQIAFSGIKVSPIQCAVRVMLLTLSALLCSSCSFLNRHVGEACNTRAYVRTDFEGFINQRFTRGSPVRMAVIPFDAPANLAGRDNELPGIGNRLSWGVQRELLGTEVFPVVEVLNRQDWPGKKEEFFAGNFGALSFARAAGYDLVLVGAIEPITRLDEYVVHSKIIEAESGITLWFGTSRVVSNRADMLGVSSSLGLTDERPDIVSTDPMLKQAAECIAYDITHDPDVD